MNTALTLTPLFRQSVGFDRFNDLFEAALKNDDRVESFPPYNIEKLDTDRYRITMAVAGFSEKDLTITAQGNTLLVAGKIENKNATTGEFLHRGIATRSFERKFSLADHMKIVSADMEHGLLHVSLVRELPEEAKTKMIPINVSSQKMIDAQAKKK